LPSRVIHDELPHRAGRYGEEVTPVVDAQAGVGRQLEIGVVDQVGRLQETPVLPRELPPGQNPQLLVDERQECVEGCTVTVSPGDE
jgi:hypothetical protein